MVKGKEYDRELTPEEIKVLYDEGDPNDNFTIQDWFEIEGVWHHIVMSVKDGVPTSYINGVKNER